MKSPTKLNLVLSALAQILKWIPVVVLFLPVQILCMIVQQIGRAADATSSFFQDAAFEWNKIFAPTFCDRFDDLQKSVKHEKERGDIMAESYIFARNERDAARENIAELNREISQMRDEANGKS